MNKFTKQAITVRKRIKIHNKINTIKSNIQDFFTFLFDKNFGFRFKIANIIMGDYLRNYLAVGVMLPLDNIIKDNNTSKYIKSRATIAKQTIVELMEM